MRRSPYDDHTVFAASLSKARRAPSEIVMWESTRGRRSLTWWARHSALPEVSNYP